MDSRLLASLSRAERRIDKRSRCAVMNVRRSSPLIVGGISVPEFERSRAWFVLLGPAAEVAAVTALASRA